MWEERERERGREGERGEGSHLHCTKEVCSGGLHDVVTYGTWCYRPDDSCLPMKNKENVAAGADLQEANAMSTLSTDTE